MWSELAIQCSLIFTILALVGVVVYLVKKLAEAQRVASDLPRQLQAVVGQVLAYKAAVEDKNTPMGAALLQHNRIMADKLKGVAPEESVPVSKAPSTTPTEPSEKRFSFDQKMRS